MIKFCEPAAKAHQIVEDFEKEFCYTVGSKHCVAVNSGYTALFLALYAIGIREGDEVIVPDFTMIATALAVRECGGVPVFVDVETNGNIDWRLIEEKITDRTKAIMPVHIYGHPAEMDEINDIARRYDLWVVEDAAEAHGAEYKGRKAGNLGDLGCFSFYSNKIISTGEGGAITTDSEALAEELRKLRSYHFSKGYLHDGIGWSFRMNPHGAEKGLEHIGNFNAIIERKRQIADLYNQQLKNEFMKPIEKTHAKNVYWMYGIKTPGKEALQRHLAESGIETRDFFVPMTMQPIFRDHNVVNSVARELSETGLLLPSMPQLTDDEIRQICEAANSFK